MKLCALTILLAACSPTEGERCNPLQYTNDCAAGLHCVYPTPACGVAYCCGTDSAGNITDPAPACQPIAACVDASVDEPDGSDQ